MLQQRLLERAGEKRDFLDAVNRLAKDFNLIIEGDYKNGFFHRARKTNPQPEVDFSFYMAAPAAKDEAAARSPHNPYNGCTYR